MYLPEPTGNDFELPPQGTFAAVCYRVIDLGTQESSFNGETSLKHKIMVSWELPDERMEDNRPFTIHQSYTWSMHEKATLRKHLEAWRGRKFQDGDFGPDGFNIKKLLGVGCLLTITHTEKDRSTYANLTSIAKLMKGQETPQPENEIIYFSMESQAAYDETAVCFEHLSDRLIERIKKSPEHQKWSLREPEVDPVETRSYELDDDIPF